MTGKTHLAIGVSTALLLTQPTSLKELGLCLGMASIGAVISDIDVSTSKSYKGVNKIIGIVVFFIIAIGFIEYRWKLGIVSAIQGNDLLQRTILGIAAFLAVCAFGKNKPHRSFMHSALAILILSGIVYFIYPMAGLYFGIAMTAHVITDLFNKKKVLLLYPIKSGFCFNLCYANGATNYVLFRVANTLTILEILYLVTKMGLTLSGS